MWRTVILVCMAVAGGQQTRPNRVASVSTTCDKGSMTVHLEMAQPFKGIVFSKDFSRECRVQGNKQNKITLHLPSNACGVRTSTVNTTIEEPEDDEDLYYNAELVVQMDKQLQQSSDQELLVRCKLQARAVRINSSALESVISNKLREMTGKELKKTRTGRNRQGFVSPAELEQRELLMEAARAWMELSPTASTTEPATVEVGQPTRLLIQCTLPVGVGLRVTNCIAHDGLGEASQKLLDEAGCPIDEMIFNTPSIHHHKHKSSEIDFSDLEPADTQKNIDESINIKLSKEDPDNMFKNIMTYQHAITTFAAFKFPDRAKLHLTCGIELCKGPCPVVDCKVLQKPQQTRDGLVRKARLDKDAKGVVIDRLEVYNSIEVHAPNIELEDEASIRGSRRIESEEDEYIRGFSPGDKTICLSPGKMALAFCVLARYYLENTIATAKGFVERAKERIDKLCTLKTLMPEYFAISPDMNTEFKRLATIIPTVFLPMPSEDHHRISLLKLISDDYTSNDVFIFHKYVIMLCEYIRKNDYMVGMVVIVDFRDRNILNFVAKVNPVMLRQIVTILLGGYGLRLKGINIITESKMVGALLALLKQVLSEKITSRLRILPDVESLHGIVTREVLPVEYGGQEEPLKVLCDNWIKTLIAPDNLEYFKEMAKAATNETNRRSGKFNQDYLGIPGSFRTLAVD